MTCAEAPGCTRNCGVSAPVLNLVSPGSNVVLDFGGVRGKRFGLSKAMCGPLLFRRTSLLWQEG